MADWHLEERMQTSPGGVTVPHYFLVRPGIEVRIALGRGWFLEYQSGTLKARFAIYRDPPGQDEDDLRLGPHCAVRMLRSRLSRPLAPQELAPLAINVKEALRLHLTFPGGVPPQIERVRFLDEEFQQFSD